jgi:hypothetical protein
LYKFRVMPLLMAVAMLFTLSACRGPKESQGDGNDAKSTVASPPASSDGELDTVEGSGIIGPEVEIPGETPGGETKPGSEEPGETGGSGETGSGEVGTPTQEVEQPTKIPVETEKPATNTGSSGGQTGQTNTKPSTGSSSTGDGSTPVPPGDATDSSSDSGIGEIDMNEINDWFQEQVEQGNVGPSENFDHQFDPVQTQ